MKQLRLFTLAVLTSLAFAGPTHAQGLRAEVGKPLQQASELLRAGKAREALAKAREADRASGKTAAEQLTIDRMMAAAAQRAGDSGSAIKALESIYGRVGGAEQGRIAEQLASTYAQARNNGKAGEWLAKAVAAGNNSDTIQQLQSYLQSATGDYAAIARDAAAAVSAAERAGRKPAEADLLRLADAQQRMNNSAGQVQTLEKLALAYPKTEYWNAFLGRLPRKSGFSDRLSLDVLRLRLATGTLTKTDEYMEMAQLTLQDGFPAEALDIIEKGTKAGLLGTGPEAARHQRLRDLAVKQAAALKSSMAKQVDDAMAQKDGNDMVKLGYAYVTEGDVGKGIDLIQKGIATGKLKRPADATLRLGMAQLQSAQTKAAGVRTLRSVKGTDGVAEIARTWATIGFN